MIIIFLNNAFFIFVTIFTSYDIFQTITIAYKQFFFNEVKVLVVDKINNELKFGHDCSQMFLSIDSVNGLEKLIPRNQNTSILSLYHKSNLIYKI